MSNVTFAKSVDAFVAAQNKQVNAFGTLSAFAYAIVKELTVVPTEQADVLKNAVSVEEQAYKAEHPKMAEFPTTYRSAKSVIMSAVKYGVSLVDEHGKPVGKSALEAAVKDAKGDSGKPELDKFRSTMATAAAIFAKLDTLSDVQAAKLLVTELASMVVKAEATLITAAASSK
jgi:epoxyqueuosine reductase QueG